MMLAPTFLRETFSYGLKLTTHGELSPLTQSPVILRSLETGDSDVESGGGQESSASVRSQAERQWCVTDIKDSAIGSAISCMGRFARSGCLRDEMLCTLVLCSLSGQT